jgi:hypothetical protein
MMKAAMMNGELKKDRNARLLSFHSSFIIAALVVSL